MKNQLKINRIIIIALIMTLGSLLSACEKDNTANMEYIDVSGVQVDLNATEVNLHDSNISDTSTLYSMHNLEIVDLRNNPINQDDILAFIKTNPNVKVIWSIPVYAQQFDSNSEIISFLNSDKVNISDIEKLLNLFTDLKTIELYDTNISADDYATLKNDYPNIDFNMTVTICAQEFDSGLADIDLSGCSADFQATSIDKLKYFNEINSIFFGDKTLNNEIKDSLIEKYAGVSFDWATQLLDKTYSSADTEIDISGQEVLDLKQFKNQIKYMTSLSYIDMCDCSLTNLQMEELIAAYPKIKFVWKIQVGSWEMRTDIKAFGTCYTEDF